MYYMFLQTTEVWFYVTFNRIELYKLVCAIKFMLIVAETTVVRSFGKSLS